MVLPENEGGVGGGEEEKEAARCPIQSLSTQKFVFVTFKNL